MEYQNWFEPQLLLRAAKVTFSVAGEAPTKVAAREATAMKVEKARMFIDSTEDFFPNVIVPLEKGLKLEDQKRTRKRVI